MRLRIVQTERLPLRLVLDIDTLQFLVHHLAEVVCRLLVYLLVLKLKIEVVATLLDVGKTHEELRLDAGLFLCLVHRLNELRLIEFLARHRHDTVYLRHHMDGRRIVELAAHLY